MMLIFDVICLTNREVFADLFLEFAKLDTKVNAFIYGYK